MTHFVVVEKNYILAIIKYLEVMSRQEEALDRFREFLQFETVSVPAAASGVYQQCVDWLQNYIEQDLGLACQQICPVEGKPILLATWLGTQPELPSILLNSHYDVVPVSPECWNNDAFSATVLEDGFIVGRGTQDMKSVCIQYIEALKNLKGAGFKPTRTVHLSFVPDEEIGGAHGMGKFLESREFKAIQPIAIAFDEGLANPLDAYTVFYGERVPWWLIVNADGPTGHGSRFVENTAMQKIMHVCNKAMEFRADEEKKLDLANGCRHGEMKKRKLGDVTTINLTMLNGGVTQNNGKTYELNVIPTKVKAGFDCRISPDVDINDFKAKLDEWCSAEGVSWEFADWTLPIKKHYVTSLDESSNPWWNIFLNSAQKQGMKLEPEIFPAGTDSRFLRKLGIPAFGFSPMTNTEILLHEHNEMLHKDVFFNGIEIYTKLFQDIFAQSALPGEAK